jgi:hypothetical protein
MPKSGIEFFRFFQSAFRNLHSAFPFPFSDFRIPTSDFKNFRLPNSFLFRLYHPILLCHSAMSAITKAAMLSTIGTARGTTQGSWRPLASSVV